MSEQGYTIKEILDLQFKNLGRDVTDIKDAIKEQNINSSAQFKRLDMEIDALKTEVKNLQIRNESVSTKSGIMWAGFSTVVATIAAITANRIF